MDYVSVVVGNLKIEDINLELSHMEIVDLSVEDFKSSPRLREALRNKEIALYNPRIHQKAVKIKQRNNVKIVKVIQKEVVSGDNKFPDLNLINKNLEELNKNFNILINKMDSLLLKNTKETPSDIPPKSQDLLQGIFDLLLNQQQVDFSGLENAITKLSLNFTKGVVVQNNFQNSTSNNTIKDDVPLYVPELNTNSIKTNIVTKEESSSGTEDILKKLKEIK